MDYVLNVNKKNFFTPTLCYNKYAFRKSKSIVYGDTQLEKKEIAFHHIALVIM